MSDPSPPSLLLQQPTDRPTRDAIIS